MSKEKQIEDISKILCGMKNGCDGCMFSKVHCNERNYAEEIYASGYRKQSEGEWIIKSEIYKLLDDVDEELYVECSICQRRFNVPYELDDEKIFKYAREHYPYCNCGAKMKGGE